MKIAIGLPNVIGTTRGHDLIEWARHAEDAGFSSVGAFGVVADHSHEELITLAAAAAVTERIGLATTILTAPVRETVMLAKQAASLDSVSGGRFSLGLGAGWRAVDFEATGAEWGTRGARLEAQVTQMRHIWAGGELGEPAGTVAPAAVREGGPELLIGGSAPAALDRAGRLADGFIAVSQPPAVVKELFATVVAARERSGRPGRPRLVAGLYYALGDVEEEARANLRRAYEPAGPELAERMAGTFLSDPDVIRGQVAEREAIGMDELFLWPTVSAVDQVERLAEILL